MKIQLLKSSSIWLFSLASMVVSASDMPATTQTATRSAAPGDSQSITIMQVGSQPSSQGSSQYFTGVVRIDPLFSAIAPSRTSGGSVTFEPGARSAWHSHPAGQVLIVTAGAGRVQRWGGPVEVMRAGDVIRIPPGVKHWHGAAPATSVTHFAIQETVDGRNVDWMEHVSDEQYGLLIQGAK